MEVLYKPCGVYQTNCYIASKNGCDLIIDPGENAFEFVVKNVKNPIAILNTHGHSDHIFSNASLKKYFNLDVYVHKDDNFMLKSDIFGEGYETINDAIEVKGDKFEDISFKIGEFDITYMHFPGHTPGCSMIRVDDVIFSGDFLFYGSIGRYDFPYSNREDMRKSIEKCLKMSGDFQLFPGHGQGTTLKFEQSNLPMWLKSI
ncbi:MBL fold metallo-hydrolase [Campylobacter sp.]|uniref:MBL fold metallo-hydrolase n=1 Tax=Campylobacter sp. TaxID=205 RepID=UPI0026FFE18D|nr:MBL fold metallo-hydrolase [Campylobacter sp.]